MRTNWMKRFIVILGMMLLCLGVSGTALAASKKIALNYTEVTLNLYEQGVKLRLCNAKGTVKWKSSDKNVATVKKGRLTAHGVGRCQILAKHRTKTYICQVTVTSVKKERAFQKLQNRYPNKKSKGKIVLAGGSNLRMWGNKTTVFASKNVVNVAVGGSRIDDWKDHYRNLIVKQKPKAVVLYVGANDLAKKNRKDGITVGTEVCELLEMIHEELPKTPIFYVSVLPTPKRWSTWDETVISNSIVKQYCSSRKNLYFIDCDKEFLNKKGEPRPGLFRSDGVHLNKKGRKIWNQLIAKKVKKKMK